MSIRSGSNGGVTPFALATRDVPPGTRNVVVLLQLVDGTGSAGPARSLRLAWSVDTIVPNTTWPAFFTTAPGDVPVTNNKSPEFSFNCTRPDGRCTYQYSLDGGNTYSLGGSTSGGSNTTVDTAASITTPLSVNSTVVLAVAAVVGGLATPVTRNGSVSLQYRVDDSMDWVDVNRSSVSAAAFGRAADPAVLALPGVYSYNGTSASLTLLALPDGFHAVDVRAVHRTYGYDVTPSTLLFVVSTTGPVLALVSAPPNVTTEPFDPTPRFQYALVHDPPLSDQTQYLYTVYTVNGSGGVPPTHSSTYSALVVPRGANLRPNTTYGMNVTAVDYFGRTSAVVSYTWTTGLCSATPTDAAIQIADVTVYYDSTWWAATWAPLSADALALTAGYYEYAVFPTDSTTLVNYTDAGWTSTRDVVVDLPYVGGYGVLYTVLVRVGMPPGCPAGSMLTDYAVGLALWLPTSDPPGSAVVASSPPSVSTSLYALFEFGSTADMELVAPSYQLDGGDWTPCNWALSLGPLSTGSHTLTVVVTSLDSAQRSWPVAVTWTVLSQPGSTIVLNALADGLHTLLVTASDSLNHTEASPRPHSWRVDTAVPRVALTVLAPVARYTNVSTVSVRATCSKDLPCQYCWMVVVNSGAGVSVQETVVSCTSLGSGDIVYSVVNPGNVSMVVYADDAIGNSGVDNVSTVWWVYDPVAPSQDLLFAPDGYVSTPTLEFCVFVDDEWATETVAVLSFVDHTSSPPPPPLRVPLLSDGFGYCGNVTLPRTAPQGRYNATVVTVDAAGNPSTPSTASFVLDTSAPGVTLRRLTALGCVTSNTTGTALTSCDRSSVHTLFAVSCFDLGALDGGETAACAPEAALQLLPTSTSCVSTTDVTGLHWGALEVDDGVVNITSLVALALQDSPVARFVLWARAVDEAGNVGNASRYEWWVDTAPPDAPVVTSAPDAITTSTIATLVMKSLTGLASPGQLTFTYTLAAGPSGGPFTRYAIVGGSPAVPPPSPVNTAPSTLVLPNLTPGQSYVVTLVAVSQSGVVSANATSVSWHVLAAAPTVAVLAHPADVSGGLRPVFVFAADWGEGLVAEVGVTVQFQMALVGDDQLSAFHAPRQCANGSSSSSSSGSNGTAGGGSGSESGSAVVVNGAPSSDFSLLSVPRDCVDAGCDGGRCVYRLTLKQGRGTTVAYTLQVRTVVFSSFGQSSPVLWSTQRCGVDEYAVFSYGDAVNCVPCPPGGDCSGGALLDELSTSSVAAGIASNSGVPSAASVCAFLCGWLMIIFAMLA